MSTIVYTILGLFLIGSVMLITLATGILGITSAVYCLIQEIRTHPKEKK